MKADVVFVPGLLGDRGSFADVQTILRDSGLATFSYDYPSYHFSLEDVARESVEVMKRGGCIVGASMGGYVALLAAERFPRDVGKVVLVNTFASARRILGWRRFLIKLVAPVPNKGWIKLLVRKGMKDSHFGGDERVKSYVLGVLHRLSPEALFARLKALAEAPDVREFPPEVLAMVVYVMGDPTVPQSERKNLFDLVNPQRTVFLERGGHFPYLANPDGFAENLLDFLKG